MHAAVLRAPSVPAPSAYEASPSRVKARRAQAPPRRKIPTASQVSQRKKRLRGGAMPQVRPAIMPSRDTLLKVVCTDTWAEDVEQAMREGKVRRQVALGALWRALWHSGFYPPRDPKGTTKTMVVCPWCGVDCPPAVAQPVDLPGRLNGTCPDCREILRAPDHHESLAMVDVEDFANRLTRFVAGAGMLGVIEDEGEDADTAARAEQLRRTGLRRLRAMLAAHQVKPNLRRAVVLDGLELDALMDGSASAAAMELLATYNVSIPERRLAPEDEAALKREIRAAEEREKARKGGTKK